MIRSQGSEKIEGLGIITDAEESTAQEKKETEDAGHNIDMDISTHVNGIKHPL